jgi:hypothetical protein
LEETPEEAVGEAGEAEDVVALGEDVGEPGKELKMIAAKHSEKPLKFCGQ